MHFDEQTAALFQYLFDTANGTVLTVLLAGVPSTKRNIRRISLVACLCFSAVVFSIFTKGLAGISVTYALCVHLPYVFFFTLVLRRPLFSTLAALILTYFLGAPRFILGTVAIFLNGKLGLPLDEAVAMRLGWGLTGPLLFWPIYRFLVPPLRDLIGQSSSERPYLLAILGSCYMLAQYIFGFTGDNMWPYLFVVFFFAFLASILGYSRKLQEHRKSSERLVAFSVQNEALAFYCDSLVGYLKDTARLRHDYSHFLTLLHLHADRGDLAEIRRLTGDTLAALNANPGRVTGNNVVDATVTLFRDRAEEAGVSIELSGASLLDLPLKENDLCMLLSNCLTNAIDATRIADERKRTVSLSVTRNDMSGTTSLVVRNPCPAGVLFAKDSIPLSTKGPGHGYGTSSMRTIVERHGGVCAFAVEDGEFVFRASFPPPPPASMTEPRRSGRHEVG